MKRRVDALRRGHVADTLIRIGPRRVAKRIVNEHFTVRIVEVDEPEAPRFKPLTPLGREMGRIAREELLRARARVARQLRRP